jgi:hypothetical protein
MNHRTCAHDTADEFRLLLPEAHGSRHLNSRARSDTYDNVLRCARSMNARADAWRVWLVEKGRDMFI